jgi:non-specific serine/threonine protein kinase
VLDLLLRLVEKSLVLAEAGEEGADRYRLLETLRRYALEELAATGDGGAIRTRHTAYYLAEAEQAGAAGFGPRFRFWFARMRPELNNVRAALRWAVDTEDVERALHACGALDQVLCFYGQPGESRRWLAELLASPAASQPTTERARALLSAAQLAWDQLDLDQADRFTDEALAIAREREDQASLARALYSKARVAVARGSYGLARTFAEESLATARAIGNPISSQDALMVMGQACFCLVDYATARTCFEQAIAFLSSVGVIYLQAPHLDWLGHVATATGDYGSARARYAESMRLRLTVDRKVGVAYTLSGLAGLAAAQGDLRRAVCLSGAAARLCEVSGVPSHRTQEGYIREKLPGIREALGVADYDAAWAEGRTMSQEQLVAYAVDEGGV